MDKIEKQLYKMIEEISATDDLLEARVECLKSNHVWECKFARELNLTPEGRANIAFTLGRACQLGVLFGILHHTGKLPVGFEEKAKEKFKELNGKTDKGD